MRPRKTAKMTQTKSKLKHYDLRADLVEALVKTPGPFDDTRLDDDMFQTRQANDARYLLYQRQHQPWR